MVLNSIRNTDRQIRLGYYFLLLLIHHSSGFFSNYRLSDFASWLINTVRFQCDIVDYH